MSRIRLKGDRVVLQQVGPEDAARVAAFHVRNWEHLGPWSPPRPPDFRTAEGWRGRLEQALEDTAAGVSIKLYLVSREDPSGDILGNAGLSQIVRGPFLSAYVGYALDASAQGQGLMTEALRLLVAQAFGPLALHRLQANYIPSNTRSGRVLARLGFEPEGLAKNYLFIGGAWRDHVMTALLNPEHPGPEA